VQKNTAVVMFAGGNVYMQNWLPETPALLYAWYPGQEGGTAIAEILFGKTNPSGKLPVSFEKKWSDNPTFNNYYDSDGDKRTPYKEGIYVGYRYFDTKHVDPMFPFGFGLSYTTFEYSNLKVEKNGPFNYTVTFTISNTGKTDGAEIAQLYVSQKNCSVDRPVKELKGFAKIFLKAGESKNIVLNLNKEAFEYFHPQKKQWLSDTGEFELLVGSSSKDLRLKYILNL
jgi:beta-glucosidase